MKYKQLNREQRYEISAFLCAGYRPTQIARALGVAFKGIKVSHETIYRWIRQDKVQGGDLYKHCRHRLKHRKRPVGRVCHIPHRLSIHEMPQEAKGNRLGDFEMDLIIGAQGKGAILVVRESMTNMIWARKLENKSSSEANNKLWAMLVAYKRILKTIVTDNGSEFAGHQWITRELGVPVFFTDPYSAWQKGAVEHANKLIRQYIPKNANFDNITQEELQKYCNLINNRPRKNLCSKLLKLASSKTYPKFALDS